MVRAGTGLRARVRVRVRNRVRIRLRVKFRIQPISFELQISANWVSGVNPIEDGVRIVFG